MPTTVTSIPLVDPHAPSADPSIGDLVKDATAQVSTLVRAEVELAKAEITRDVKKGLTGSVFFILALVVLFYSTFFFFFFLAELLDTWLWRWVAFLIVFGVMVLVTAVLGAARLSEGAPDPRAAEDHRIGQGDPRGADARATTRPRRSTSPPTAKAAGATRPTRRAGNGPTRSVGRPHRRSVAPSRGARQRHPLPRRRGRTDRPTSRPAPVTERPLVILLHGFGSFWWSWRHQLRGLTGARVVAVDLRGYGGSDKPPRGYDGWTLAGDTAGLVRALGHTSATLVGHADGGLVCWATSVLHPRLVRAIARGQLAASGRAARVGADPARPGPGAAAVDAALPGADVARAVADPHTTPRSSSGWCAVAPVRNGLPPKTSPRRSATCGGPSRFRRPRIRRWSTSAGRCAASCAARAGGSCGR